MAEGGLASSPSRVLSRGEPALFEGVVEKRQARRALSAGESWQARFFALRPGFLMYYHRKPEREDASPVGWVRLAQVRTVRTLDAATVEADAALYGADFGALVAGVAPGDCARCVLIHLSTRTLLLRAETAAKASEWVRAVSAERDRVLELVSLAGSKAGGGGGGGVGRWRAPAEFMSPSSVAMPPAPSPTLRALPPPPDGSPVVARAMPRFDRPDGAREGGGAEVERLEVARLEGARSATARSEAARSEGPRTEGPRTEGPRFVPEVTVDFVRMWDAGVGLPYFVNGRSGESSWALPDEEDGWVAVWDDGSASLYFAHPASGAASSCLPGSDPDRLPLATAGQPVAAGAHWAEVRDGPDGPPYWLNLATGSAAFAFEDD
jgi:PH domain